jgi:hypothetical protein
MFIKACPKITDNTTIEKMDNPIETENKLNKKLNPIATKTPARTALQGTDLKLADESRRVFILLSLMFENKINLIDF